MNNGWETVAIKDVCEAIYDGPHATPEKTTTGPIFLGISNLQNGQINLSDSEHLSEEDYVKWTRRVTPRENDIVFSYETRLGEAALVPKGLKFCLGRRMALMRPDTNKIHPRFLLYAYLGPEFQQTLQARTVHGSTVDRIPLIEFPTFPISLPPLPEQRAIAGVLGALDDKIELNRRMNRTLESLARAVFRQWFVESEEVGDWNIGRLDDLLVLQRGFDLPAPQRIPGKYPVLAASGPSGTHNEFKVKGPGVTTGRSGVIGQVYFVHEDFWPLNTSLWIKEFKLASPAFSYYLLKTLDFAMFNAGSAVPTLNRNHVHNLPLSIPPLELIKRFENFAMPLLSKVNANGKESRTLASVRDALLPKLMRGEVRVKA